MKIKNENPSTTTQKGTNNKRNSTGFKRFAFGGTYLSFLFIYYCWSGATRAAFCRENRIVLFGNFCTTKLKKQLLQDYVS